MILARCVDALSRTACTLLFFFAIFAGSSAIAGWDSEGAARSFESAGEKRERIAQNSAATLADYLDCARTYRSVYLKDPHYRGAGDAIYEEAVLYQEAAGKFSRPELYETAVKRFQLLVKDYPGHRQCPNALIRLGTIQWNHLNDPEAARASLETLRSAYRYSAAAIKRIEAQLVQQTPRAETVKPAADAAPRPPATIRSIRHWTTDQYARVAIDLDSAARYQRARLRNPDRIYFDISDARLAADLSKGPIHVGDPLLTRIRMTQNGNTVRIVMDLTQMPEYSVTEMQDPFRIVIDLPKKTGAGVAASKPQPSSGAEQPKAAPPSPVPATASAKSPAAPATAAPAKSPATPRPAQRTSNGDRSLTRMLGLKVGRIVLDPGHGGHDLGSEGPGGLLEKDLVLSLALDLAKMLQDKLGAEVVLTRTEDVFVPLEERTAIANSHKADLFVSIHANSSRSRATSGVETYYLDFARNETEREIAARENASSTGSVSDLEDLIKKIAQADKSTESRELASIVQKKLHAGALRVFPSTQNRGVRRAPFIVLIGANMPSILAEVAFISNPRDERLLKKETTRQRLVEALFAGIEEYMNTLGSRVVQSNQGSSQSK